MCRIGTVTSAGGKSPEKSTGISGANFAINVTMERKKAMIDSGAADKFSAAEIFTVKATRCLRCGGILLSDYGLKHGMGHVCKQKYDLEHQAADPAQVTFFDEEENQCPEY